MNDEKREDNSMDALPVNWEHFTIAAMIGWVALAVIRILLTQRATKKEVKELKSEIEKFLRPQIRFYVRDVLQRRLKMKDTEKQTATIEVDDAKGFPTGGAFDQPPVWAIDDPSIASLVVADDGLSCDVVAQKPGNAKLSVAGVVAAQSYAGETDVVVTAGDAASIKISLGAPVAQ